jgi:hypothetical protein
MAPSRFPRAQLSRQAVAVMFGFGLVVFAVWAAYRWVGAFTGDNRPPATGDLLMVLGMILGISTWNAFRNRREALRNWLHLVSLWRRGEWKQLLAFPCAIAVAGILLGAACSVTKWFTYPPGQALQFTLIYAAAGGSLGFLGGWGSHLPSGVLATGLKARGSRLSA